MQRLAEGSIGYNSLVPLSRTVGTYKATGVDSSNCLGVLFEIPVGDIAAGAAVNARVQESETDVDGAYVDIAGSAITQLADTDDGAIPTIDVQCGALATCKRKRYLRCVVVTTGTVAFAVVSRKYGVTGQPAVSTPAAVLV